jgi:anti-sigma regulatory factor (Ser/Thr protein kinase)
VSDWTSASAIGPVLIRLPPDPSLSRVLRLAAGGIAAMGAFTVDETEDIKIAVSEVLLALIEHGSGYPIDIEFSLNHSGFSVRGITDVDAFDTEHPDLMLCRTVLAGVCARHGIELVDHQALIWAVVPHTNA